MKKRALSWLLAVVMLVSLAPQTIPWAKAADPASTPASQAKNAFGLTMEEKQAITYGDALKNNPYGTTAWIPLFQDHELVVAGVHDDEFQTTYTGGADGKGSQMSSFRWGHGNYGIGNARRLVNVAFDPYGTGRDEYIATLAFDDSADRLRLYVTNKDRNVVSAIDLCGDDAAFIDKLKFYQTRAMLCIEAGDFDGDGKDTLMVYVPGNNTDTDSVDSIKEYKLADSKLSYTNRKINLGDVLDGGREALKAMLYHNGNGSNELRAHLSVDMAVGDVDMDGVEELAVTVNVNDLPEKKYNGKEGHEKSYLAVYDYANGWDQSAQWELGSGSGRARFAGVTIGYVNAAPATGTAPSVVAVGYRDKNDNNENCDLNTGSYRVEGYTYSKGGGWQHTNNNVSLNANGFTNTGTKGDDNQNPLAVAAVSADGAMTQEYLFVSGTMYKLGSGSDQVGNTDYPKNRGINGYIINNTGILDYAVGNFDGNKQGREQVYYVEYHKQETFDKEFLRIGQLYKTASQTGTGADGEPIYTSAGDFSRWTDGWTYYGKKNCNVAITAADVNNDAVLAKIEEISYGYNDPKIMAILEASPHFSELNDGSIGNSATSLGQSKSESTSTEKHGSFGYDIMAGFEYVAPIIESGGGIEFNTSHTFTFGNLTQTQQDVEITRSNDSTKNMVVMYATPMTYYKYRVKNPDGLPQAESTMYLSVAGKPATNMVTVEEYNQAAASYNMDLIGEGVLGTPGKPNTYRGSLPNDSDKHSWSYGGENDWVSYGASDTSTTTTQSITDSTGTGKSFAYEYEGSVEAYAIAGGFKVGSGWHWGAGTSKETMSTEAVTKEGAVTGGGNRDYDFNWKFATWTTHLNGADVPILGYLVQNVKAPPSPAQDLVLSDQTTTTMKLSWEEGDRPADYYKIWRKTQEGTGVNYAIVAQVSAASENGSYEYELTGLFPNQQYEYVITSGSYTTGLESVYSEAVVGRTLSADLSHPDISIAPKNLSGELGDTVKLEIDVTATAYDHISLQWQERLMGGRWKNIEGATKNICKVEVTNKRIGAKYRCVVSAYTTATDKVPFYSESVALRVGTPNASIDMTIENAKGGSGTPTEPYIGQSNYDKVTTNDQKVNVTTADTVEYEDNILLVFETQNNQLVGITAPKADTDNIDADTTKYYALTKEDNTYIVGKKLTLSEVTTYKDGDTAVTLPANYYDPEQPPIEKLQTIKDQPEKGIETIKVDLRATGDAPTNYITYGFAYLDGEIYNTSTGDKITTDTDKYYQLYGHSKGTGEDNEDTFFVSQTVQVNDSSEADPGKNGSSDTKVLYYIITLAKGTDGKVSITRKEITSTTTQTLSGEGFTDVTNPTFTAVQTTTEKTVTNETRTTQEGTGITLHITTKRVDDKSKKLGNVPYTVTIVNTTTGAVSTLSGTTNTNGAAAQLWRAPVSGLYAITTATASGSSAKSNTLYYLAGIREEVNDNVQQETVYTLDAPISMTYGEIATLALYERNMAKNGDAFTTDKTPVSGVVYTARLVGETAERDITASFKPDTAGSYIITAYQDTNKKKKLASTTISVERASLTLAPSWDNGKNGSYNAPTNISGIGVTDKRGLVETDRKLLSAVKVACGLYKTGTGEDGSRNDNLSGRYDVTLWVDTTDTNAATLLKKYNITMESGMLIRVQATGTVNYKTGENGTLEATYGASTNQKFNSGQAIPYGESLSFIAVPSDSGYKVSGWMINGQPLDTTNSRYKFTELSNGGVKLTIPAFAASDLASTTNALAVEVTFSSAAHKISYTVKDNTGGKLKAESGGAEVTTGQTVADSAEVTFTATPDNGKAVAYWMVDNKTYNWPGTKNPYRENTLTLTGIMKDYDVSVAFEDAKSSTVTANVETETGVSETSLTLSAKRGGTTVDLTKENNAPIGSVIRFTLSGTGLGNNITVKEWKVDGKIVTGSGGKDSFDLYVTEGSHTVTAVVAVAQHYTVTFANAMDGAITTATVTAKSNGTDVVSGDRIAAYLPIEFTAAMNENYYVTRWTGATQDKTNPNKATISSLSSNVTVSVQTAEKPKVRITSSTSTHGSYSVVGTRSGQDVIFTNENVGTELNPHVDHESKVTITATPKEGYYVKSIKIVADNVSTTLMEETSKETYQSGRVTEEISSVTQDTVIDIEYAAKPTVTITNNDNVTITAEQGGKPLSGKWVEKYSGAIKFTAEPTTGYEIDIWNVEGWEKDSTANDNTVYTQNGPITENVTINVQTKEIPKCKLTLSVKELGGTTNGGTISANITRKALPDYNAEITTETGNFYRDSNIEIVPRSEGGYRVQSYTWNVNGTTGSGETIPENLLKNVQGDVQIEVCYVKLGSGISFGPLKEGTGSENGYISAATLTEGEGEKPSVMHKASGLQLTAGGINFTAIPAAGYEVEGWYKTTGSEDTRIDSMGDADDKREFTFTPESGDTTVYIHPKFRQVEYEITTADGVTVSPSLTNGKARGGTALTFTAPSKAGKNVTGWTINDAAVTTGMNGNTLTWTVENGHLSDPAVTSYDVQPTYENGEYTVSYSDPAAGGTLTATVANNASVAGNTQVTFTAVPDAHYEVDKWTVNNVDSTETGNKLSLNITDNTTVAVSFKLKTYSVTLHQTEGGTATASPDETTATALETVTFTATPDTGWHFAGWKVVGSDPGSTAANPLTLSITGNTTVEPVFTKQMVGITAALATGSKGTIAMTTGGAAVPADGKVPYGTTVTVTVTPENASDMVDTWTVNGDVKSQMTADADAPLSYDVTVTGETDVVVKLIEKPKYTVTISATGNGTANIGGVSSVTVGRGDSITATAAANNGSNYLKNWLVNNTETPKNGNTLTVGPIRQETAIVAVFDELVRQKVMFKNATDSTELPNSTSTVAIKADGNTITPGATANDAALVVGNSKVIFTATVPHTEMVGEWTINGVKQDNLSNTLTIDDLRVDTKVTVKFVSYKGYNIPTDTEKYTIDNLLRIPNDTKPDTQIRAGGTVEFEVKAKDAGKSITKITLNDCGNVTTTPQADGSIKVTVKNVKAHIKLTNVTVVSSIPLRITTPSNGMITVKKGSTVLKNGDKVMEADELTITATPNSNYTLDQLTVNGATKQNDGTYKVKADATELKVEATFKASSSGGGGGGGGGGAVSTYTLTFDTNGGSAIDKITKDSGTTIDLAAYKPTRAGYTFAGWFSDKALTKAVTSVKLTANTTVYAKWTQNGGTAQNPFVDVKEGAYYYDAVLWAVEQKITSGTSATTFSPDASCTRAQMVTFLWRAAGSPKVENGKNPFADVKADAYYYDAVLWAVEKGVTSGTSATTFSPDATVTRGQTVTFLYRNAGSPEVSGTMPFTDVEADAYYAKAVQWAVQQKITTGTSETTFSPMSDCTRGQIVTFLYRAK